MDDYSNKELTETEQAEGVSESNNTPLEKPGEAGPETPNSADSTEIIAALDAAILDEEKPLETPEVKVKTGGEVEKQLDEEARKFKAGIEAAGITGAMAMGIERVLDPVVVTQDMREDFHQALVDVMMNRGGGAMPEWMARIWKDWEKEINLARKTVCIGWAIWEQRRDIKSGKLKPASVEKKRYRLPVSETTKRAEAA